MDSAVSDTVPNLTTSTSSNSLPPSLMASDDGAAVGAGLSSSGNAAYYQPPVGSGTADELGTTHESSSVTSTSASSSNLPPFDLDAVSDQAPRIAMASMVIPTPSPVPASLATTVPTQSAMPRPSVGAPPPVSSEVQANQVMQRMQSANGGGSNKKRSKLILFAVMGVVILAVAAAVLWWWSNREVKAPVGLDQNLTTSESPVPVFDPNGFDETAAPIVVTKAETFAAYVREGTFYRLDPLTPPDQPQGSVLYIYNKFQDELAVYAEIGDTESLYALWGVTGEGNDAIYSKPAYSVIEGEKSYISAFFPGTELQFDRFVITKEESQERTTQPTEFMYSQATIKEADVQN